MNILMISASSAEHIYNLSQDSDMYMTIIAVASFVLFITLGLSSLSRGSHKIAGLFSILFLCLFCVNLFTIKDPPSNARSARNVIDVYQMKKLNRKYPHLAMNSSHKLESLHQNMIKQQALKKYTHAYNQLHRYGNHSLKPHKICWYYWI